MEVTLFAPQKFVWARRVSFTHSVVFNVLHFVVSLGTNFMHDLRRVYQVV